MELYSRRVHCGIHEHVSPSANRTCYFGEQKRHWKQHLPFKDPGCEPNPWQHPLQSLRLRPYGNLPLCPVSLYPGKKDPQACHCYFCTAVFWHFLLDLKCNFIRAAQKPDSFPSPDPVSHSPGAGRPSFEKNTPQPAPDAALCHSGDRAACFPASQWPGASPYYGRPDFASFGGDDFPFPGKEGVFSSMQAAFCKHLRTGSSLRGPGYALSCQGSGRTVRLPLWWIQGLFFPGGSGRLLWKYAVTFWHYWASFQQYQLCDHRRSEQEYPVFFYYQQYLQQSDLWHSENAHQHPQPCGNDCRWKSFPGIPDGRALHSDQGR